MAEAMNDGQVTPAQEEAQEIVFLRDCLSELLLETNKTYICRG